MGFISDKLRNKEIKKINKGYGFRKFLMIIEMAALFAFIIVVFLQGTGKIKQSYMDAANKLTGFGIGMLLWALVLAILGVIVMILILTLKSPKQTTAKVSRLESSARGGRKQQKSSAAAYKDRTRVREE